MKRIRTRNKKYLSDDFTSIFTEKKDLLSEAYNQDVFEEEIVTTDDMVTTVISNHMTSPITSVLCLSQALIGCRYTLSCYCND